MARFIRIALSSTIPPNQRGTADVRWWNADLIRCFKASAKYPGYLAVDYSSIDDWMFVRMSEQEFLRLLTGGSPDSVETGLVETENLPPTPDKKSFRSGKRFQNLEYDTP